VNIEALFERLYPSLFRYLNRMTGDADAAEDIAQEAFVRLLRQDFPEEEARPWLFAVATNLLRDRARKIERRQRLLTMTPVMPSAMAAPDEQTERAEQIEIVRTILAQIPARDRQLLLMREEGFKYEEMARTLGVAPSSVGTLIARALRRFADAYQSHEAER
jgi:RNA polymerase sigma-70 factor (ECF subfamily)